MLAMISSLSVLLSTKSFAYVYAPFAELCAAQTAWLHPAEKAISYGLCLKNQEAKFVATQAAQTNQRWGMRWNWDLARYEYVAVFILPS